MRRTHGSARHSLLVAYSYFSTQTRASGPRSGGRRRADAIPRPGLAEFLWPFPDRVADLARRGLGALLMLDRGDRRGDLCACGLVAVSLAAPASVSRSRSAWSWRVLWGRRLWRDVWIFAARSLPTLCGGCLPERERGTSQVRGCCAQHSFVPGFVARAAAATLSAFVGFLGADGPQSRWDISRLRLAVADCCRRHSRLRLSRGKADCAARPDAGHDGAVVLILTALRRATIPIPTRAATCTWVRCSYSVGGRARAGAQRPTERQPGAVGRRSGRGRVERGCAGATPAADSALGAAVVSEYGRASTSPAGHPAGICPRPTKGSLPRRISRREANGTPRFSGEDRD